LKTYPALICARGGSKGVPGKNIRSLAGRPLIGWAIQAALQVERISSVIVSTDSLEIAEVAKQQGAEVPFIRPAELARDDSPEWDVWRHALRYLKENSNEYIPGLIVVPATAPLRNSEDLERCLNAYEKDDCDCVITVTDAHRSPYFNMVSTGENGYSHLVIEPAQSVFRRQDVLITYDMTTVAYVARPDFVLKAKGLFEGRVKSVHIPLERALDIDTEHDFKIAEFFMTAGSGGNE